jgi:hypothetical protein
LKKFTSSPKLKNNLPLLQAFWVHGNVLVKRADQAPAAVIAALGGFIIKVQQGGGDATNSP